MCNRGLHLTLDHQRVVNPGFNADRHAPVHFPSGRLHIEF
jgi:hypothetical protein